MLVYEANCRKGQDSTLFFSDIESLKYLYDNRSNKDEPPKNCLVLVHGYKGIYTKVISAYEGMIEKINKYDMVVQFFWPSSFSNTLGFIGALSRVDRASHYLSKTIQILQDELMLDNITIQGHSLGCAVIQKVMEREERKPKIFRQKTATLSYVYCAPAIPNSYFETQIDEYETIVDFNKNTNQFYSKLKVAYSNNDPVLKYFFRLIPPAHWKSAALGCAPSSKLLNYPLAEFHDFSKEVTSHSGYKNVRSYFELL